MKNKLIVFLIIITGTFLYPFSCDGQTNGTLPNNDSCDTVFIENPSMDALIRQLTADNQMLTDNNQSLETENTLLTNIVVNKNAEIASLTASNTSLADLLAECENKPPVTVTDTVEVELDYITVNGKEYKVADIELIVPLKEIDTINLTICWKDETKKVWLHATDDIDVYPHIIHIPTSEKGLIPVTFTDSLTLDMKRYQVNWKMMRVIDHEKGETQYKNLYIDPATYLPTN